MDRGDRVRGLVLGCALGDAVGLATEFMTKEEAAATYSELLNSRKARRIHIRNTTSSGEIHRNR